MKKKKTNEKPKQKEVKELAENQTPQALKPQEAKAETKTNLPMTRRGFEVQTMEQAWRFASALAESSIVPDLYKKRPTDCLVALDLASRLDAPWLAVMQHVYTVHGRPAMDSALCTALVNRSGMFTDPLDYEVEGEDPSDPKYMVRAFAARRSTGKVLYGPWIDWKLVKAEGWDSKAGTKWKTMPDQMFHYRAASWFQRRHCPELTMGMLTIEEAEEVPPRHVEATVVEPGVNGLKKMLAERENNQQPEQYQEENELAEMQERDAETEAKANQQKEKLQAASAASTGKSNLF